MSFEQSTCESSVYCARPAPSSAPACPVCGAALVPMRSLWRCSRCCFSLCAGCEPVASAPSRDED
jgi:hypothetical protein